MSAQPGPWAAPVGANRPALRALGLALLACVAAACGSGSDGSRLPTPPAVLLWSEADPGGTASTTIRRLDTSSATLAADVLAFPPSVNVFGLTADPNSGRFYWGEFNPASTAVVMQAEFDGSNPRPLITGDTETVVQGVALDEALGRIYYTSLQTRRSLDLDFVARVDGDGSASTSLAFMSVNTNPRGLAFDADGEQVVFLTDVGVLRLDVDGGNPTLLAPALEPRAVVLHRAERRVMWTELSTNGQLGAFTGRIRSVNLDGSQLTDVITGINDPRGLALDEERGVLYYATENADGHIFEVDLATGAETLLLQTGKVITTLTVSRR